VTILENVLTLYLIHQNNTIMTATIDKAFIRESLKELIIQEPVFVTELIKELDEDLKNNKKQFLKQIITEDFKEYSEVFKALA
jgi:hypothetical protein